jgi:hypothetical protein
MFYLCPNRLPHIQTIDWSYIHTKNSKRPGKSDIRITYLFTKEIQKWKKIWGAKHIQTVIVNEHLNRVAKRLFKRPKACGTYWLMGDIRDALLKHTAQE